MQSHFSEFSYIHESEPIVVCAFKKYKRAMGKKLISIHFSIISGRKHYLYVCHVYTLCYNIKTCLIQII